MSNSIRLCDIEHCWDRSEYHCGCGRNVCERHAGAHTCIVCVMEYAQRVKETPVLTQDVSFAD